jgi:hypothetical protein
VNPITRVIDWLGTRNRNLNADMVGVEAATFAARCVTWGLLLSLLAVAWVIVYAFAVVTRATDVATISLMLLLLFGLPIGWLSFRNNSAAARLAADHFESKLGFRPRWWMCYSAPRGWNAALERQKRWHARGRWPLIPW